MRRNFKLIFYFPLKNFYLRILFFVCLEKGFLQVVCGPTLYFIYFFNLFLKLFMFCLFLVYFSPLQV